MDTVTLPLEIWRENKIISINALSSSGFQLYLKFEQEKNLWAYYFLSFETRYELLVWKEWASCPQHFTCGWKENNGKLIMYTIHFMTFV